MWGVLLRVVYAICSGITVAPMRFRTFTTSVIGVLTEKTATLLPVFRPCSDGQVCCNGRQIRGSKRLIFLCSASCYIERLQGAIGYKTLLSTSESDRDSVFASYCSLFANRTSENHCSVVNRLTTNRCLVDGRLANFFFSFYRSLLFQMYVYALNGSLDASPFTQQLTCYMGEGQVFK